MRLPNHIRSVQEITEQAALISGMLDRNAAYLPPTGHEAFWKQTYDGARWNVGSALDHLAQMQHPCTQEAGKLQRTAHNRVAFATQLMGDLLTLIEETP